jgi:hypothetical protein
MTKSPYLCPENVRIALLDDVKAGELAYLPSTGDLVIVSSMDSQRVLMAVTGDKRFHVWKWSDDDGTAVVIPGWRITVDPLSAINLDEDYTRKGCAIIRGTEAGIVGAYQHSLPKVNLALTVSGGVDNLRGVSPKAVFAHWQIVVGPVSQPVILAENDVEAQDPTMMIV